MKLPSSGTRRKLLSVPVAAAVLAVSCAVPASAGAPPTEVPIDFENTFTYLTNDSTPTIRGFQDLIGREVHWEGGGTDWPDEASEFTLPYFSDGQHAVTVTGWDSAGEVKSQADFVIDVDATAPLTPSFTSHPAALTTSRTAAFTWNFEPNVTYWWRLDGGPAVSLNYQNYVTHHSLLDGPHHLEVYGTDLAGNQSPSEVWDWTIDATPPTFNLNVGGNWDDWETREVAGDTVSFYLDLSQEPGATAYYELDGGEQVPVTSGAIVLSDLALGHHQFDLTVIDAAGNYNGTGWDWTNVTGSTADTTAPTFTANLSGVANGGHVTQGTPVTVTITSPDADLEHYQYKLDEGSWTNFNGTEPFDLATGFHVVLVRAVDETGNQADAQSFTWTVDPAAQGPQFTWGNHPTSSAPTNTFSWNVTYDGPYLSRVSVDGSPFAIAGDDNVTVSNLTPGLHSIAVYLEYGEDGEQQTETFTHTFQVFAEDTTAPVIDWVQTPTLTTVATTASFIWNVDDQDATVYYSLDGAAPVSANGASQKTLSGLADGPHMFSVYARDAAGNQSDTLTYAWTVDTDAPADTTAPVLSWVAKPGAVILGNLPVTFTWASDDDSAVTWVSYDGAAPVIVEGNSVTRTGLAAGAHSVRVFQKDSATNKSNELFWEFTVAQVTPPATDAKMDAPKKAAPNEQIKIIGDGFTPGELVEFWFHSTPVLLGTAVADANGHAELFVDVPKGVELGLHHVVLKGLTSGKEVSQEIVLAEGTAKPTTTPAAQAETGAEVGPLAALSAALMLAGAGAVAVSRRRRAEGSGL